MYAGGGVTVDAALVEVPGSVLWIEQARDLLARAQDERDFTTIRRVADQADAARMLLRKERAATDAQNRAAWLAIEAKRAAGSLISDLKQSGDIARGRPAENSTRVDISDLMGAADVRVASVQAARLQELAAIPEPELVAIASTIVDSGGELTAGAVIREAQAKRPHVANNAGDNEWYTPRPYIEAAVRVMGAVDLDPASSVTANEIIGAGTFYAEQDNGLTKPWAGRVWMNPPYARPLIDQFAARLAEEYAAGNVTEAIVLVNNATETGWFHALAEVAAAMCFPRGRVKFWHPEKESAPLQGQAVIYLGPNPDAFRDEFVRFGFTVAV